MTTQYEIDLALMAGRAYQSTRNKKANWFPVPDGWTEFEHKEGSSGFEAVSFFNGPDVAHSTVSAKQTARHTGPGTATRLRSICCGSSAR